jgi:succinate dehydrogenase / fumarate reductase cytochrome b subunit
MRYLFYPGCNAKAIEKESMHSTSLICAELGIELVEGPELSCCGGSHLDKIDSYLNLMINARNFAIAEKKGLDILTICNTCLNVMKRANFEFEKKPELLKEVNDDLKKAGLHYSGKTKVKHLLEVLCNEYGFANIKAKVKMPLDGLKVAAFYGCHILRPKDEMNFDNPESPVMIEKLIEALGAEPVYYPSRTSCCGFHITMANPKLCGKMNSVNLVDAKEHGADIIVTPCTLCHTVMDGQQFRAEKVSGKELNIPVLHLPQLVGLALGIDKKKLGFKRHIVSCDAALERIRAPEKPAESKNPASSSQKHSN